MSRLSIDTMRRYLSRSITSKSAGTQQPIPLNQNKLNGLLAEVDFRRYLERIGFANRVSPGGWIARRVGEGNFGHQTIVFFPQTIEPEVDYGRDRPLPDPDQRLHTICATFHQIGIESFFCAPTIVTKDDASSIEWQARQLGIPEMTPRIRFPEEVQDFTRRRTPYNYLRYNTDVRAIPEAAVPDEFSKENARVTFSSRLVTEISDVDGIFWGQQNTYPLEIKEKTVASDRNLGPYFGLDLGPFVKLAYYAAKRGNLHSIFVVREIDNVTARNLMNWWFITFETLATYASWVPVAGGTNMGGGGSTTVKIPRAEFRVLTPENLARL